MDRLILRGYTCLDCGHRNRTWERFRLHRVACMIQRKQMARLPEMGTEEERRAWEEALRGD